MTFPKLLLVLSITLFSAIALLGWWKKSGSPEQSAITYQANGSVDVTALLQDVHEAATPTASAPAPAAPAALAANALPPLADSELPSADRVDELFRTSGKKLPIVETVAYKSRVPWLKGRAAWIADYAAQYHTSRHFIARSLNGKPDYLKQDVSEGDRFNVYRNDVDFQFNIVIDASRCLLALYYTENNDDRQPVLIKTYKVGLGQRAPERESKLLTPYGQFLLGDKVAIFKPRMQGLHNGQKVEFIRVFGTRWMPFEGEIVAASEPTRGLGLHGVPWTENAQGVLEENADSIGKYQSDGCIRLSTKDIEELYAIVITKPTAVEIVEDFRLAQFPLASLPPQS